MRRLLFTLLLGAWAVAQAATVYKWVDENGVTHYSDTPNPQAQKIEIGDVQTYSAPRESKAAPAARPAAQGARPPECLIDSPAAEQVLLDAYSVQGHATIVPALDADEQAVILLDNAPLAGIVDGGGGFSIAQVDRGTHTLAVKVQDPGGQVLCQSSAVTFYVRQPSAIGPTAPTAPTVPAAPGVNKR